MANEDTAHQDRNDGSEDTSDAMSNELEEPLLPQPALFPASPSDDNLYDGLPSLTTSLLIKSLYFLDALGSSTWGRFSAIYYNLHGLNSQQVGLIGCLATAIPTVSQVLWGLVADRFQARKRVWLFTKSISTVILLLLAVPWVYRSFGRILAAVLGAQLFVSGGILDAFTLDLLGTRNKMYYGRYRLYASISWGLGSIVMGWVTDHFGNFELNFALFGLLAFLMVILVAWKVPDVAAVPLEEEDCDEDEDRAFIEAESTPGLEDDNATDHHIMELVCLALRPRVVVFIWEVVIMGAAMATVEELLFLYMVNDLQASNLLCGLSVGVNVVFELPIFWYASVCMRLLGHDGMFLVAMFCFFVRVFGYTMLTPATRWLILPLEILHGVTFACFWVVTTDVSKLLVHQTKGAFWRTAIPSSVQMLYSAVGVSLGSVLGGWAMHKYGSVAMYTWTASMVGTMWVVHLGGSMLSRLLQNGASFVPDYAPLGNRADVPEEAGGRENPADVPEVGEGL